MGQSFGNEDLTIATFVETCVSGRSVFTKAVNRMEDYLKGKRDEVYVHHTLSIEGSRAYLCVVTRDIQLPVNVEGV